MRNACAYDWAVGSISLVLLQKSSQHHPIVHFEIHVFLFSESIHLDIDVYPIVCVVLSLPASVRMALPLLLCSFSSICVAQ